MRDNKLRWILAVMVLGVGTFPAAAVAASQTLNADETAILAHLEARQTAFTVQLSTTSMGVLTKELKTAIQSDAYLAMDISSYNYTLMGNQADFSVVYNESRSQYQSVLQGVKRVIARIIKPGMDVYQKEKAIHDYVVLNTAYDLSLQNYTAYDALFQHSAVCQGYAMLTYQLLNAAGIPNILISGTATNSTFGTQSHAWNEVDLNGKWYQLDTTWDDPVPNQPGQVQYNYFNLTSAQMAKDHRWNKNGLPVANTNFIQVLEHSKNPQDRQLLTQTGLSAEEPQNTYSTWSSFEVFLSKLSTVQGTVYNFRIPYSFVNQSWPNLNVNVSFSYERDTRNSRYALVTLTVT